MDRSDLPDSGQLPGTYVVVFPIQGTSDPWLHMTACYMGTVDANRLAEIEADLNALADAVLPLDIKLGERAMFGPDKNIPVRLVTIMDAGKKELLDQFFSKYFQVEPGREAYKSQTFHISIKKLGEAEINAMEKLQLNQLAFKRFRESRFLWLRGASLPPPQ